MTARELIAALKSCPQDAEVRYFVDWEDRRPVRQISPEDADGFVVLGEQLPAETYARDFQDD